MRLRSVQDVIPAHRQLEGGGFPVRRPFPTQGLLQIDPFLLLDEMGPVDWPPGGAIGAPDHPHRGFETVTYVLRGRMQHADSSGHRGEIGPGDVQWMTAGDGVVHSELPHPDFKRDGGVMHGFQIWVNLPRRDKRMAPRYQEVPRDRIPVARSEDGRVEVRVVAGRSHGVEAVIDTRTPISFLHFLLQPGGRYEQEIPAEHRAFAYVFDGAAEIDGQRVEEGHVALLGAGDAVAIAATERAQILLLSGVPLSEPVARYGPFVMNTREEILEAVQDYQAGRMGAITPAS